MQSVDSCIKDTKFCDLLTIGVHIILEREDNA